MKLSNQLYIIIFSIFLLIFTGNFVISVNNFKNYLEAESITKSQDTAVSVGMSLKPFMDNKNDPEILSIVRVIANSGFYKEIRLEDNQLSFSKEQLLKSAKLDNFYEIKNLSINKKYGEILSSKIDDDIQSQLLELEELSINGSSNSDETYSFIATKEFKSNSLDISFDAIKDGETKSVVTNIDVDKVLVKVTKDEKFDSVPQWFIDFLPISMQEVSSEISNGWKTQAVLYISANAGEAYDKLYTQAKSTVYYSLISFVIAYFLIVLFLRLILKPLKRIENLAKDIDSGDFKTISKLPWTKELKSVSLAMNSMSINIQKTMKGLNKNLENLTKQLSKDELTGLNVEQSFYSDLEHLLNSKQNGYIFSIKIDNLSGFAKNNDTKVVNKFLKEFAFILENLHKNVIAYRFFGSTFAFVLRDSNQELFNNIIKDLNSKLDQLSKNYELKNVANSGIVYFNRLSDPNTLLQKADEAYEYAKQLGYNRSYLYKDEESQIVQEQLLKTVIDCIDNDKFKLEFINNTIDTNTDKIFMKEAYASIKEQDISTSQFVLLAKEANKIVNLDKKVIATILNRIDNKESEEIVINLSFESIIDKSFNYWLNAELKNNPKKAKKIVFATTAYFSTKDVEEFKYFVSNIHQLGAKVMLKRFEIKFISLDNLKDFNLDYIRLAREYTSNISDSFIQQTFAQSICDIASLLNIKIIADGVDSKENFEYLKSVGIHGINKH